MAENFTDIPLLNPVRWVPKTTPIYKRFDNTLFYYLIRNFEQKVQYPQKWVEGDVIKLHIQSNHSPIQVDLIDCAGRGISSYTANVVPTTLVNPGFQTYEVQIPVTGWDKKKTYQFILNAGFDETLIQFESEYQQMLDSDENTLLFTYWNSFNKEDVVFDTGVKFDFRCEAFIQRPKPKSKRTLWEDQPLNLRTINAIPYVQPKLIVGSGKGVPDWVADKINRIFCCDNTLVNAMQYTAVDGAELEANEEENYPMAGWSMDIRPTNNKYSLRGTNSNSPAENFFVVRNIDTKAFGTFNGNASSNIIQVTEVE
jgi:hypothetical protein